MHGYAVDSISRWFGFYPWYSVHCVHSIRVGKMHSQENALRLAFQTVWVYCPAAWKLPYYRVSKMSSSYNVAQLKTMFYKGVRTKETCRK